VQVRPEIRGETEIQTHAYSRHFDTVSVPAVVEAATVCEVPKEIDLRGEGNWVDDDLEIREEHVKRYTQLLSERKEICLR
jgi:hypothetical protein